MYGVFPKIVWSIVLDILPEQYWYKLKLNTKMLWLMNIKTDLKNETLADYPKLKIAEIHASRGNIESFRKVYAATGRVVRGFLKRKMFAIFRATFKHHYCPKHYKYFVKYGRTDLLTIPIGNLPERKIYLGFDALMEKPLGFYLEKHYFKIFTVAELNILMEKFLLWDRRKAGQTVGKNRSLEFILKLQQPEIDFSKGILEGVCFRGDLELFIGLIENEYFKRIVKILLVKFVRYCAEYGEFRILKYLVKLATEPQIKFLPGIEHYYYPEIKDFLRSLTSTRC